MNNIKRIEAALTRLYTQKKNLEEKRAEIVAKYDTQIADLQSQINDLEKSRKDLEKLFAQQEALFAKAEQQMTGKKKKEPEEETGPLPDAIDQQFTK